MRKLMIRMGSTQKLSTDNGISIWGYRKIGFGKLSMEQSLICFYIQAVHTAKVTIFLSNGTSRKISKKNMSHCKLTVCYGVGGP